MSLWIEWEVIPKTEQASFDTREMEQLLTKAVEAALTFEQVTTPTEISLTVVSEEEIRQLNNEYRGIDSVTDVLSFPLVEYEIDNSTTGTRERVAPAAMLDDYFAQGEIDPETDEVMLGDIIICLARAQEQAQAYGHSLEREMGFLAVHSVLHLLGYDHETPEEEKVMFDKQRAILDSIGLKR